MQALFSTQYFISDVRLKTQFIVHCCAKIIKSDTGSSHCAIILGLNIFHATVGRCWSEIKTIQNAV